MHYVIDCDTFEQFMDAVEQCVRRGLQFDAFPAKLLIRCTGGY